METTKTAEEVLKHACIEELGEDHEEHFTSEEIDAIESAMEEYKSISSNDRIKELEAQNKSMKNALAFADEELSRLKSGKESQLIEMLTQAEATIEQQKELIANGYAKLKAEQDSHTSDLQELMKLRHQVEQHKKEIEELIQLVYKLEEGKKELAEALETYKDADYGNIIMERSILTEAQSNKIESALSNYKALTDGKA